MILFEISLIIVAILLFLASGYLLGAFFIPTGALGADKTLEGMARFALGIGVLVAYIFCIGHLNLLTREPIALFVLGVLLIQKKIWPQFADWLHTLAADFSPLKRFAPEKLPFIFAVGVGFFLLAVPETGNDALCYQLQIPKLFVRFHSTRPIDFEFNSFMPLAMNYLYAVGILFGKVSFAKAFHWTLAVLTGVLLISFVRRLTRNPLWGWLSSGVWMLTPAVFNQASSTYVDVGVAFFTLLGFYLFMISQEAPDQRSYALTGYCFGMAVSIKLLMAAFFAPFVFVFFIHSIFFKTKARGLPLLAFLLGLFLPCGFWLIRNLLVTGNPVFPFLGKFFGTLQMVEVSRYTNMGLSKTAVNFLLLPFYLTLKPGLFGWNHWLGPCYILLLPFVMYATAQNKNLRFAALFLLLYTLVWFLLAQSVRFLIPILPLYIAVGFVGLETALKSHPPSIFLTRLAFAGTLVGLLGLGMFHYRFDLKFLSGSWSGDRYLRNLERTYPAAEWMKTNLPSDAKILLIDEVRQFYFAQLTEREHFLELLTKYSAETPARWIPFLKKHGFTHLLKSLPLDKRRENRTNPAGLRMSIWRDLLNAGTDIKLLKTIPSENIREERVNYSVYKIL